MKGGGQGQAISKAEVTQAADAILQPLMDLLDGMHLPTIHMTIMCNHKGILYTETTLYLNLHFIHALFKCFNIEFAIVGSLSTYAQICDKSVLKRLLKELWKIVIKSLEKLIVLPPSTNRSIDPVSTYFISKSLLIHLTAIITNCKEIDQVMYIYLIL